MTTAAERAARTYRVTTAAATLDEPRHLPARIHATDWRVPAGVIYVNGGSPFANPFTLGQTTPASWHPNIAGITIAGPRAAFETMHAFLWTRAAYDDWNPSWGPVYPPDQEIRNTLHGRTLACTCASSIPCHADLLLHIAHPRRRRPVSNDAAGRRHLYILPRVPGLPCCDCGVRTVYLGESYYVHDTVRSQAGMTCYRGRLCIGCLEARLGRQLTAADFTDCPANDPAHWHTYRSPRFIDRLSRT